VSPSEIRKQSALEVQRLGYPFNPTLPLLDGDASLRSRNAILSRALALHCVVASSHGFPKHRSLEWLERKHLLGALTGEERTFLNGSAGRAARFQVQGECLWMFAWVCGKVNHVDFGRQASEYLVSLYPDLKASESSGRWQAKSLCDQRVML
jgi:hypothetical protein